MDPSPENNRAAWYQGPMKLEVVTAGLLNNFVFHEIHKTASAARKAFWVKVGLKEASSRD